MSLKAALVSAALVGGTQGVSALTVDLDYQGTHALEHSINVRDVVDDRPRYSGAAGGFKMQDLSGSLGNFVAWCLDLSTSVKDATYDVLSKSDTLFTNGKGAVLLSNQQKSDIQSLFDTSYATVSANLDDAQYSGGFQLALWEIVYERGSVGYGMGTGIFQDLYGAGGTRTAAFDYANLILAGIADDDTSSDAFELLFLESELKRDGKPWKGHTSQNLVTGLPTAVPLPATGLLLLGGIAGFVGLRRRKG
jgi:hypothetical protein